MKRCPECRRDYYDDTLLYCLDDGNALLEGPAPSEAATRAQINTTDQTKIFPRGLEAEPQRHLGELSERPSLSANQAAEPQEKARRGLDKRLLAAPFLLAIIVLGGFLGDKYFSPTKQIESIAVMPFVNESGNADVEYLSDGMTETLISSLSRLPNLKVKARNSVFRYKGKEISTPVLGEELSVQSVLLGRVAQYGDQLTLRLELVDAPTETIIWSEQYKRKQSDLLGLQTDIARDVSNKLKTKLSGADQQTLEKRPTGNTEAFRFYLQGRYEWNKRKKDTLLRAVEYFNRAIESDPNFALAYAGLADCYIVFNTYEVAPPSEAYPKARAAAQRALDLDDSLGEVYATLAAISEDYDWDFEAADRNYQKAIALNPNYATAHQWYGEYLRMAGRMDEALVEVKRALEIDPVSLPVNSSVGLTLFYAGRYDEAAAQMQRTIELDPSFAVSYGFLGRLYSLTGRYEQAIAEHRKAVERSNNGQGSSSVLAAFAHTLAKAGKPAEARKILERLEQRRTSEFVDGAIIAPAYSALGDNNTAFAKLDRAYRERSPEVRYIKVEPLYGPDFRSDPRYQELVQKIGLP